MESYSRLEFQHAVRRSSDGGSDITFMDFRVDGKSLLALLDIIGDDFISCFDSMNPHLSREAARQLTLADGLTSEVIVPIYVCPLCADIGCGAVQVTVKKSGDDFVWENFAYVDARTLPEPYDLERVRFAGGEYLHAISEVGTSS